MKKFSFVNAGTLALCAALVFGFAACSNAAGGNGGSGGGAVDNGGTAVDNGGGTISASEKTLDLRIKKNGVLYGGAETSGSASAAISLSAANDISFAQASSGEQVPGDDWDDRLWKEDRYQTTHVKVENVEGGIKFTIKRPEGNPFDPYEKIRLNNEWYDYVGDNNGDFKHKEWKYVGAGKGDHVWQYDSYSPATGGDYTNHGFKEVGEGKGYLKRTPTIFYRYNFSFDGGDYKLNSDPDAAYYYVGSGNGNYVRDEQTHSWKYVDDGSGDYAYDYNRMFEQVEPGTGDYIREEISDYITSWVKFGEGDWIEVADSVTPGTGDFKKEEHYKWVGDNNGDYVETFEHVGANQGNYIKKEDWQYGGFSYAAIYRHENISGLPEPMTTRATLPSGKWNNELKDQTTYTCVYPLCEPGERYVFQIALESSDYNLHRADPDWAKNEFVSIVAQDGIGDIDYSYLDPSRNLELKYDGEKPIVKLVNCIAPINTKSLKSVAEYFAGNKDWQGESTQWIAGYTKTDDMMIFDKDPCMEEVKKWAKPEEVETYRTSRCFNASIKSKGKKEFFAVHYFSFIVPEMKDIDEFRTIDIKSEIIPIE